MTSAILNEALFPSLVPKTPTNLAVHKEQMDVCRNIGWLRSLVTRYLAFVTIDKVRACTSVTEGENSIVQDQISQQLCPYRELSVVVDQSHCSEFIHEVGDARTSRTDHFGQGLMTQHGNTGIRNDIMFP